MATELDTSKLGNTKGATMHFNVGDMVTHAQDPAAYGKGIVTGHSIWNGRYLYTVRFVTAWGQRIPEYEYWELVKV